MRRVVLLLAVTLAATGGARAQTQQARIAPTCSGAEYRQFDFWIGEWRVKTASGRAIGSNRVTPVVGGCALREEWQGTGGNDGTSLNFYDPVARVWRQSWVDDGGQPLELRGGMRAGRMVLESNAGRMMQRITWIPFSHDSVRQIWQQSSDGGRRWRTVFDGIYMRVYP